MSKQAAFYASLIHGPGAGHRIETAFEHPPIPTPPFWRAWSDSLGADTSPYGEGATEQEAIDDLLSKLEDMT
jgi:hypothetical protein